MNGLRRASAAVLCVWLGAAAVLAVPAPDQWLTLGGDPEHSGLAASGPANLASFAAWPLALPDPALVPVDDSSLTVANGTIYALFARRVVDPMWGTVDFVDTTLAAFDAATGDPKWAAPPVLGTASWGSTTTPTIDVDTSTIIVGNGHDPATWQGFVYGVDAQTGAIKWTTRLDHPVVNASAVVGNKVAYITDFDMGGASKLYAINLDPAKPGYGEVVWSEPIGSSSGNTPAYHDGKVYVASSAQGMWGPGEPGAVYGFDAEATNPADRRMWTAVPPNNSGFFGGLGFSGGFLYANTYNFGGGGELWKLDATDGGVAWGVPAGPTNAIPVVMDGRVFAASGITDWWVPQVLQCFADTDGALLWQTPYDSADPQTWYGYWKYQLAAADGKLYLAAIGRNDKPVNLMILDAAALAGVDLRGGASIVLDNIGDYLLDSYPDAGTLPALANGALYTMGYDPNGRPILYAFFGQQPPAIIPEPASLALLGIGALALARRRRG